MVVLLFATSPLLADQANGVSTAARPLEADEVAKLEPTKLKQLVVKTQDQIEVTSRLDGVLVVEMRLRAADDQRNRVLELEGRVHTPEQRVLVGKVVLAVMQTESFWATSDDEFIVNGDNLKVTEPSSVDGSRNLALGIDQFLVGQHEQADMLFTVAIAECPNREVIQYWKAANAIALKQPERAEHRLEVLTRRNAKGSDAYAAQLQKMQGPLRQSLLDMERRVMLRKRQGTAFQ
jgi:hypothetical protein